MCVKLRSHLFVTEVKLLTNDIGHWRNIKDVVNSKKKDLEDANNRMIVNRDQIEKYENKLKPIVERLNFIHEREVDITKLYTEKGMCVCIHSLNYRISRPIRHIFFPKKCDLNLTCVLCAEGKYYFQTYKYQYIFYMKKVTHRVKTTMKIILVAVTMIFWVSMMNKL